jgi:NTE family protein
MTAPTPRIGLVLGGGGLKGFAHLGVLRVLEQRGITPVRYAGSSIGGLVAAAYASGTTLAALERRARILTRKDLFRVNTAGIARNLLRSPSFYAAEPLQALIAQIVPDITFDALPLPVIVNTVDLERAHQIGWGAPGFRHASVRQAVYASCALPGFFPPGMVEGRTCADGGTVDNLPVTFASQDVDLLIAVDVGSNEVQLATQITEQGVGSIFMRAATLMMRTLQGWPLQNWHGPPLILIRPRVNHLGWFNFENIPNLIEAGEQAAREALACLPQALTASGGVFPQSTVKVEVVKARCTGCGSCLGLAPRYMQRAADGLAEAREQRFLWSPCDGDFVSQCPTGAILVTRKG